MTCYKFKDQTDGNYIFVISKSEDSARARAATVTSLALVLVGQKPVAELGAVIIYNSVCPF